MVEVSFKELLKYFSRLFTGFSVNVYMILPDIENRKLSATFHFFITNDLDLSSSKFILAQAMSA